MASQVIEGLKIDNGFKLQAIHVAIGAMKDAVGVAVSEANVSNYL